MTNMCVRNGFQVIFSVTTLGATYQSFHIYSSLYRNHVRRSTYIYSIIKVTMWNIVFSIFSDMIHDIVILCEWDIPRSKHVVVVFDSVFYKVTHNEKKKYKIHAVNIRKHKFIPFSWWCHKTHDHHRVL